MCRRYILVFCVCLSLLVSCSFCLADNSAETGDSVTIEQSLYSAFGFEDIDSFYNFCDFLMLFEGSSAEDMQNYLDNSPYSVMGFNGQNIYDFWTSISEEYAVNPLVVNTSSLNMTINANKSFVISWKDTTGSTQNTVTFYNMNQTAWSNTAKGLSIDFSQLVTKASLNTTLSNYSTTAQMNTAISNAVANVSSSWTSSQATTVTNNSGYINTNLSTLLSRFTNNSTPAYTYKEGAGYNIRTYSNLFELFSDWATTTARGTLASERMENKVGSIIGGLTLNGQANEIRLNTGNTVTWLSDIYNNQLRGSVGYRYFDQSGVAMSSNQGTLHNLNDDLSNMLNTLFYTDVHLTDYLKSSSNSYGLTTGGHPSTLVANTDVANLLGALNTSIVGLAMNEGKLIFGGSYAGVGYSTSVSMSSHTVSTDPTKDAVKSSIIYADSVMGQLLNIYNAIELPIKQLQAVLADDSDLELKRETHEQTDAVIEDFTGDGGAAPSIDNIKDTAGISTGISDTFETGVSVSDGFGILQAETSFSFFTQAVSDDLNGTGISPASDDDPLDVYEFDENGFAVLKDQSEFSISDYLGRDLG